MPSYYVAKDAFVCEASGYLIFLDLVGDRYFALPPESADLLRVLLPDKAACDGAMQWRPTPHLTDDEPALTLARELQSQGLLIDEEARGKRFVQVQAIRPQRSLRVYEKPRSAIPLSYRARFRVAQATAIAMLKVLPLKAVVEHVRLRKSRNLPKEGRSSADAHEARMYDICSALQPAAFHRGDACLRNSLSLIEFLAGFRIYPDWMFGVRIPPFVAHSWVQHGSLVLNDSAYHVRTFTPIMVV